MTGLPAELLYLLILVGMFVVQYLMKRLARRRPRHPSPEPPIAPSAEGVPLDLAEFGHAIPRVWTPSSPQLLTRFEAPAAGRPRPRRRYSRQALLGTRRDVQNAVVIAAIIGPCRALEPTGDAAAQAVHSGPATRKRR